jgi:transcriptional regulator with XRE-family HTH domain
MAKMRTLDEVLGAEIQRRRQAAGLKQDELALHLRRHGLDWGQATISAIEAGRRQVSLGELTMLASAFSERPVGGLLPADNIWVRIAPNVEAWLPAVRAWYGAPVEDIIYGPDAPASPFRATERVPAISQSDRKAARAMPGVSPARVSAAAIELWGRSLADERDARLGDPSATAQKRGRVTRQLIAELEPILTRRRKKA